MDKGSNDTAEKYLAKKNNDSTTKVLIVRAFHWESSKFQQEIRALEALLVRGDRMCVVPGICMNKQTRHGLIQWSEPR